ncbi:phytoene desaturase family protein [Desulfosarcina sp.]|uniref:phytoene desaturase family protein n=1 Tax=Desulfosarcina sp. TaxID=2027861 RepID=UPI0039705D4A
MRHHSFQNEKALIVGSGVGGLSMGIILAGLGFSVTVVEKNRQPGGMLRSYVRRGIHCNMGLHYLGALDQGQVLRRLFDYLGITENLPLQRMGANSPVDRYLFTDAASGSRQFDVPVGLDAYEAGLKEAFPKEQDPIDRFMALVRQSARELDRLEFIFNTPSADNLIDRHDPLWCLLDRMGCSPGLKSVLSVPCVWFGVPPRRCPQFYHTMTLASYLVSAWRLKCHGTRMAEVLVQRLIDLGGTVLCGQAVRSINVREGRATGLTLKNGTRYDAPVVVAAVHPSVVVDLLGPKHVKPSYGRRIAGLVNTGGMFAVNAIVPADAHVPLPYNVFSMKTDTAGSIDDVIFTQLRSSSRPEYLLLSLITRGYDELWKPWENTRTGHRGDDYNAAKSALANRLIKAVEPVTGPLNGLDVIDTYTPLTIRDWVNSPNGSAYGVMRSDDQMLSAALLNRANVKGLYLAGQNVMAPGVLGTILGSLVTTKFIVGPQRFGQEIRL